MTQSFSTQVVERLIAAGRSAEALVLLNRAAAANDAEALHVLGMWHLVGNVIRRDLAASREFFRRSAAVGHVEARHIYTAFAGNGTGAPSDWPLALTLLRQMKEDLSARRQLQMIEAMNLTSDGAPIFVPEGERLSKSPEVTAFRGLLTLAECQFLAELAKPRLERSVVLNPQTGQPMLNPVRTSDGMAFPLMLENPAVHALNRRLAAASGTQVTQGEPLQILRYSPGQEYKAHVDALPVGTNQRILTMLVYLNEDYAGGETKFLETGLGFKGRTGDALLFRNASADGRPDPMARHAGLPVTRGQKLIASRWIRAKPLDLMSPTG